MEPEKLMEPAKLGSADQEFAGSPKPEPGCPVAHESANHVAHESEDHTESGDPGSAELQPSA